MGGVTTKASLLFSGQLKLKRQNAQEKQKSIQLAILKCCSSTCGMTVLHFALHRFS